MSEKGELLRWRLAFGRLADRIDIDPGLGDYVKPTEDWPLLTDVGLSRDEVEGAIEDAREGP